jgi:phosphopantothenoylcysteine decarboxylase/phosphopantothenate--cysteine ligase
MPVLIVPAMHHSMYRHPAVLENLQKLKTWGISIIEPRIEEGKAKIADTEEIVLRCERAILGRTLAGKRVLITSGPCREPVDDVRVLTTRSSGQMGKALALQAFRLGADVTIVHNDHLPCVNNLKVDSASDMHAAVHTCLKDQDGTDIYISAAAVSDFAPKRQKNKIPSGKPAMIRLEPLPKLIDDILASGLSHVVAFKLDREPEKKAQAMIEKGVTLVLMNPPETMGSPRGEYVILSSRGSIPCKGTKDEIAAVIWETLIRDHLHSA